MPTYDYLCINEECESVKDGNPFRAERFCKISDSNDLPECVRCHTLMPKTFIEVPAINWRYLSANGVMVTSQFGPAQRADRRLAGYDNQTGQAVMQPIYRDSKKGNNE